MGQFAYASSKACFTHLSRMLGTIYKDIKVRVNVIAPAVFPSEMTTGKSDENNKSQIDPSSQNPAGRKGKESDMAATILFLAGKGGVYYNEQISESAHACIAEDLRTDLACSFSVPGWRPAACCPISQIDSDVDSNQKNIHDLAIIHCSSTLTLIPSLSLSPSSPAFAYGTDPPPDFFPPCFAGLPPPLVLDLALPVPVSPADPCRPPSCCPLGWLMSVFAGLTLSGLFESYKHHLSILILATSFSLAHLHRPSLLSRYHALPRDSSCSGQKPPCQSLAPKCCHRQICCTRSIRASGCPCPDRIWKGSSVARESERSVHL